MKTLLTGGSVFDGEQRLERHDVLIANGTIVSCAPAAEFQGYEGARLDLRGHTVMPGLIDCHVHLVMTGAADVVAALRADPSKQAARFEKHAEETLRGGVTTLRDLGGAPAHAFALRERSRAGEWRGPTLHLAGFITRPGGHGHWLASNVEAGGVDACRARVRDHVRLGFDWIKIAVSGGVLTPNSDPREATYSTDEIQALIGEAARLDRPVAAHALGATAILRAVDSGVRTIEHGTELTDEALEAMIARNVALVPTLLANDRLMHAAQRNLGLPQHAVEKVQRFGAMRRESFRRFVRAGGTIAMGTDAGTPFNPHGNNARELELMVQEGATPLQALRAATSVAAELLGSRAGRIAAGRPADLLVVRGDPLADVTCVSDRRRHAFVFKRGAQVPQRTDDIAAEPPTPHPIHDQAPSF
ncbi:MAG: amidohydrolase family protein [Xanthomonadaceae bacterium]|nr:amidohydrolase family protein [Xanthomonadaceae bacterium]